MSTQVWSGVLRYVLLVGVALLAAAHVEAQGTGTIRGQVVDAATQRPLTGVQIVVAGVNRGGLTDARGMFLISAVPPGTQT
ncbi:MAG: carboxypeptidase-like regulatory domain-containing protein, partial [Gemmatimonadetes bacterium]|nr:carboxypeptidase-like regulatory domain-containing protein [Gemmatimonadota bacterium]